MARSTAVEAVVRRHAVNIWRKCDELVKKELSAICRFRLKRHIAIKSSVVSKIVVT